MTEIVEGVATIEDLGAFLDRLDAVGDEHGVAVQAFDARAVVDRRHLERAVELANRAVERGNAVARDRGVEIVLYAAGRRQIDRALELGVSADAAAGQPVAVVVDGGDDAELVAGETAAASAVRELLGRVEPTLGECDEERVRAFYDVSDAELAAVDGGLADLVRERVALLTVER